MKKLYFKALYYWHCFLMFIGVKKTEIIKIWHDEETENTCLFLKGRSTWWYMPVGTECKEKKHIYSNWRVSFYHMSKYGLMNDKKNRFTIYTLINVKERV